MHVGCFCGCSLIFYGMFATLFQSVSSVIGSPLAAVGTDLSRPHTRIYPQNGGRKCVCGEMEMCV